MSDPALVATLRELLAKTTPGPWTTEPGRFWIGNVGNNVDDPGIWSAYVVKEGESYPFGSKEADAELLALAPRMAAYILDEADAEAARERVHYGLGRGGLP